MATMEKHPNEGFFQASEVNYDERLLHDTKSSAADARDMARMGKPQEMKVQSRNRTVHGNLEAYKHTHSATLAPSRCSASA